MGSLNADLVFRTSRIPAAGETMAARSFDTGSGGKGANQAVACARLSRTRDAINDGLIEVQMIGAVGDDPFGKDLIHGLNQMGINTDEVSSETNAKTGVAAILVEESGENRILLSQGANFSLRPNRFERLKAPLPDLIVLQLEIPIDTVLQILDVASRNNVEVILNPAPAHVLPHYKGVTHLIVNESEASQITGNEEKDIDWLSDCPERKDLLKLGPEHIVITLGSRGGCYVSVKEGKTYTYSANVVSVRDTTAAGDTFVGAYAVAITSNEDRSFESMVKAIVWANQAASITVQREGAQASIPWKDEVPPIGQNIYAI